MGIFVRLPIYQVFIERLAELNNIWREERGDEKGKLSKSFSIPSTSVQKKSFTNPFLIHHSEARFASF